MTLALGRFGPTYEYGRAKLPVTQSQVVTKDSRSGFTVYVDEAAIRETVALATGDKQNSVIFRGAEQLAADPLVIIKSAIAEAKSLADAVSQSGKLETLLAELPGVLGIKPALTPRETAIQIAKIAEERTEAAIAVFEKEMGRPATNEERKEIRGIAVEAAKAIAGINKHGMANVDAMSQDGGPWSATIEGENWEGVPEDIKEIVVKAQTDNISTGDHILVATARGGRWINAVDPDKREAFEKSVDVALGGPVKAVAGWAIEYGIQRAAQTNPALVQQLETWANEAGIWGTDQLSAYDEEAIRALDGQDKAEIEGGKRDTSFVSDILTVASLVFGVDVPGFGKGKVKTPDVDATKLPASPPVIAVDSKGNSLVGDWSSTKSLSAPENALKHWSKHSAEFPEFSNAGQYVAAAQDFVNNPPAGTLTKVRPDGDAILYNPTTNTFAVKNSQGEPKTMFKPDPSNHGLPTNMDYFDAQ